MDSVEPVVVKTGSDPEVKDGCNNVKEETNTASHDLASSKPLLTRCTRSRFVHHPSSFSYKRMLPFLMDDEISSQEGERAKIRRVTERQLASDGNGVLARGEHHTAVSEDSSKECIRVQTEMVEEEKPSEADGNDVFDGRQLQPAVPKASPPECSAAEVCNVTQQEDLTSSEAPLTSCKGELTLDRNDVQAGGQHQLVVSEESPEECNRDEVKRRVQGKSDEGYDLDSRKFQPAVSEIFPLENSTAEVQKAIQEEPLPLDGDEENSDKGDLAKEQPQPCVTKESLTAKLEDIAEFVEVPQYQNSDSGCHDVGFGSPTKTVVPLLHQDCAQEHQDNAVSLDDPLLDIGIICRPSDPCAVDRSSNSDSGCHDVGFGSPTKTVVPLLHQDCAQEHQDNAVSLDDPLLDIGIICRPSDPCAVDRSLSVEEMSGCVPLTESGPSKAGILRPRGAHSMEKRGPSPKKLSPRKGILKGHTRGCKGICMCLDCSTYRLRADRAFEFSRKQMLEADDIISNLLKEVASLRSLVEKPAGQRESTQAACRRASRVEEVARNRCRQMFLDLNSHCRIPGPRVKFAQYVEEKKPKPSSSPRSGNQR